MENEHDDIDVASLKPDFVDMRVKTTREFRDEVNRLWRYDTEAQSAMHFAMLALQDRVEKVKDMLRLRLKTAETKRAERIRADLNGG